MYLLVSFININFDFGNFETLIKMHNNFVPTAKQNSFMMSIAAE